MNELKTRLSQIESDLRGLREDKAAAGRKREETKKTYAEIIALGDEAPEGAETEAHANAMEAVRSHGEIADNIEGLLQKQNEILKITGDREAEVREQREPESQEQALGLDQLLGDETMVAQMAQLASSKARFGNFELGEIIDRDSLALGLGGTVMAADVDPPVMRYQRTARESAIRPGKVPVMPLGLRDQFSFLSLIPTGTTDGNLVPYTQEAPITGASSAREVAEGALKPEGSMNVWIDADAPVQTIAVWMKARKQVLADVPALRSMIDARLRFLAQQRLAEQVLNGDGTGVNLRGLMQTAGIGTIPYNAAVPTAETVLSGITAVYLNDGAADATLLHPLDWFTVLTQKAHYGGGAGAAGTAGSYEYYGGGPFAGTPSTLWGVRVLPNQALGKGTGLVADFGLGAQLLIREGLQVLFSDSDQDDFLRNRVTMLAEMRAALLVWRPALFQKLTGLV